MAELNNNVNASLRAVRLEDVARYLRCDPERLRIALRRLAEDPSGIEYGVGKAAFIYPATVTLYSMPTADEVQVLEELMMKPDLRSGG